MASDQDLYMSLDKTEKVIIDKTDNKQEVDLSNVGTNPNSPSASSTLNSLLSTQTSSATLFPGSSSTSLTSTLSTSIGQSQFFVPDNMQNLLDALTIPGSQDITFMVNQVSFMMDWQQQMLRDLTNASRGSLLQTSLVESQQTQQELQQGPNHRGEDQFTLPSIGPVDPTPVFSVPSLIDNSLDYKRTTELVQAAVKMSGMKRGMSQTEWGNILRRIHTDWH